MESEVITTAHVYDRTKIDNDRLVKCLISTMQEITCQYGVFNKFHLFQNHNTFKIYNNSELSYRIGINNVFVELVYLYKWNYYQLCC